MFEYSVFDNFIPEYHQECIRREIQNISWKYNDNISAVPIMQSNIELAKIQHGFSGNIFSADSRESNGVLLGLCLPMIAKISAVIEENTALARIRAGMFTRGKGIHSPHVDFYSPHYTLLYYVDDSDGDTYIYKQIAVDRKYPKQFDVHASITPKAGRAVLFNGLFYHSSSYPEYHDTRTAININLMLDNDIASW